MSTKKQQIQWIREDITLAEQRAKEDRRAGLDGKFQDGKAAGLRAALKIMGVNA